MAILSALQSAAMLLVGKKPGTFFGATGIFENELCEHVNEVAEDIAKYQDWQALVCVAELTGDGATQLFDLPADYDRQLVSTDIQTGSGWCWGYQRFSDINAFLYEQTRNFGTYPGGWIIYGDKLRFSPAPTQASMYPYITKNWARSAGGDAKPAFDSDNDEFLLPERLLKLGLIWRWRENKKLDATGDQDAFVKALDEYAAKDGGSKVLRRSSRMSYPGTHIAWPWPLGGN